MQDHAFKIPSSQGWHLRRYVVLNRPWAFVQWLQVTDIKERFVLMSEPDHIWLKPMPNLMTSDAPAAFPFFYIEPAKPDYRKITEQFTGKLTLKQAESIAPIGRNLCLLPDQPELSLPLFAAQNDMPLLT